MKDEGVILLQDGACGESVKVDSNEAAQSRSRPVSGIKWCFTINGSGGIPVVFCLSDAGFEGHIV